MCLCYNVLVDSSISHHILRVVTQGRPSTHRRVCVLSDLTKHSSMLCGCVKCKPDADFPHKINKHTKDIEPLPENCHVCVNGTIAFDTPEGVFAIDNIKYFEDGKPVKVSNMPRKNNKAVMTYEQLAQKGFKISFSDKCTRWFEIMASKKIDKEFKRVNRKRKFDESTSSISSIIPSTPNISSSTFNNMSSIDNTNSSLL